MNLQKNVRIKNKQVSFSRIFSPNIKCVQHRVGKTVKLSDKEHFDKEQISVKELLSTYILRPIVNLLSKDREHLALRNNFRETKKFLIAKFDCTS